MMIPTSLWAWMSPGRRQVKCVCVLMCSSPFCLTCLAGPSGCRMARREGDADLDEEERMAGPRPHRRGLVGHDRTLCVGWRS